MVILLIFCALLIALLAYTIVRLIKAEDELHKLKLDGRVLGGTYTVTDSDIAKRKPKKIPAYVRKILLGYLADDIETYFPYMHKEEINGYTRYSYKFRIIPQK